MTGETASQTTRVLVPSRVAAKALGVTPACIRKLKQRGRLTRYGGKSRALYDMDEIRNLASVNFPKKVSEKP